MVLFTSCQEFASCILVLLNEAGANSFGLLATRRECPSTYLKIGHFIARLQYSKIDFLSARVCAKCDALVGILHF